jgi:hypothetical protein
MIELGIFVNDILVVDQAIKPRHNHIVVAVVDDECRRRGVFTSVPELVTAIDEYIVHHNTNPKPFIWTKSARDILH